MIIIQAQLDDSTKCSKARCIKIKEDYETLTAENEKNTVYLKKTIEDLTEQLTTAKLMVYASLFRVQIGDVLVIVIMHEIKIKVLRPLSDMH